MGAAADLESAAAHCDQGPGRVLGPIFESCYSLHIKPSSSSLEQICFSESHSPSVVALGPGVMTAAGLTF
jgi:hypothetical protein